MRFTDKYDNTYLIKNINLDGYFVSAQVFNAKGKEYEASICFGEFIYNDKYDLSDCEELINFLKDVEKRAFRASRMLLDLNKIAD